MRLSEEQYEIIEAYLTNELSDTDRATFERDLQADDELRTEVDRQRNIRLGLRALGIERALERAKAQYQTQQDRTPNEILSIDRQPTVKPLGNWRYWAAAASVVALLGVGYYAYQSSASRQVDLAYAETLTPGESSELLKGFPTGPLSPASQRALLTAMANFKVGHYDAVITELKTMPADKQTFYYKNYLLGLSYLANNQSTAAIPLLVMAQTGSSASVRKKAEWFLALAYVKNDQKEKALPILKRISTDKAHPFHALSQRVLQKIH